jgi:Fis family transcriptional regulator, factor for inversion stimulation protein
MGAAKMSHTEKKIGPLSKHVTESLETYLENLDGHKASNLYQLVLEEVEPPLFKIIMQHVKNNQSKAANILGLSRGTLRKKLKQYKL